MERENSILSTRLEKRLTSRKLALIGTTVAALSGGLEEAALAAENKSPEVIRDNVEYVLVEPPAERYGSSDLRS